MTQTENLPSPQPRVWWNRDWTLGPILMVATVLAYQPVWQAGFIWDDDAYVWSNPLLTAPDGLWRIWFSMDSTSQYFPLTYTTFRLEHALWGFNPAGYHWVNILLHATNALLVWQLLKRLSVPGAWLAAAIFALHPVQVESVAWITELKNVLMFFFYLLTLLAWLEFLDKKTSGRWMFYALALVFYALALCAKTTACTLPAALLLILWLKAKPINRWRWVEVTPFVMLGIGMGLLTMWWERFHQGTQGKLFSMGLTERILVASHAVWFYAGKLIWPNNLTFSYPRWTINPADPFAYGWLVAGVGLGTAIYFTRRFAGRGVEVGVLFFVVTLSPVLGFIMLYTFRYSFVADHYQYVASLGLMALFSAGLAHLAGYLKRRRPWLEWMVCIGLLLTLWTLTWRQARTYYNDETIWQTTTRRNPNSWMAWNNLGIDYFPQGRVNETIAQYQKALAINPDFADAHYNLACVYFQQGRLDDAIVQYQKALAINPDDLKSYSNLAGALLQQGRPDEAIAQLQDALAIQPYDAKVHNNLGLIYFQQGRRDEAVAEYQAALVIDPDFAKAHSNLGNALLRQGRQDAAIAQYQAALAIQPDDLEVQNNLAWVLATCSQASLRNGHNAVELAQRTNQLSGGGNPAILCTLAAAYAEAGQFPEAMATCQQALQLAKAQSNTALADELQSQIKLYQAGLPFHGKEKTTSTRTTQ